MEVWGAAWGGDSKASRWHDLSEDTSCQATSSASQAPNYDLSACPGGLHPWDGLKVTRAPRQGASHTAKYKQTVGDTAAGGQDGGTRGPGQHVLPRQDLHQGGQRGIGRGSDQEEKSHSSSAGSLGQER